MIELKFEYKSIPCMVVMNQTLLETAPFNAIKLFAYHMEECIHEAEKQLQEAKVAK